MKRENLRLLELLMNAGFTDEKEILSIGLPEILKLGKLSYAQLALIDQLQDAIRKGHLLEWIAGLWPEESPEESADG